MLQTICEPLVNHSPMPTQTSGGMEDQVDGWGAGGGAWYCGTAWYCCTGAGCAQEGSACRGSGGQAAEGEQQLGQQRRGTPEACRRHPWRPWLAR